MGSRGLVRIAVVSAFGCVVICAADPRSEGEIANGADAPGLVWQNDPSHPWFWQSAVSHDRADAIRSGPITHNANSWVEAAVTGPGVLSFWWRVSCEGGYDKAEVLLDGQLQRENWNAVDSWLFVRFNVPAGSHAVRWAYVKDGSETENEDAAWVDEVKFEPTNEIILDIEVNWFSRHGEVWLPATEPGKTLLLLRSTDLLSRTTNASIATNMIRLEPTNGSAQFFRVIVK